MSLDNILKKIKEQSEGEAALIRQAGEEEIAKIVDGGKKERDVMEAAIRKEETSIDTELSNAILLPARMEIRGAKLKTKQQMIDRAFTESVQFSDDDYQRVLDHLFSQIPTVTEGTIHPAKGKETVTKAYITDKKINASLGDAIDGLEGGFILKSGRVEYDCSFDTLLKKLKEQLETEIAPLFTDDE